MVKSCQEFPPTSVAHSVKELRKSPGHNRVKADKEENLSDLSGAGMSNRDTFPLFVR